MYHKLLLVNLVILILGIINCYAKSTSANPEALKAVSTGVNEFSSNFYKTLADAQKGNLICSPLSVNMVLAMLAYGAKGNTETNLKTALHMPSDPTLGKNGYQSLIDTFNGNTGSIQLELANKIYTKTGFQIKPEYLELTKTYFRSEVQSLDFGKSTEAAATINQWCKDKTKDKISKIVEPGDLSDAVLVLLNAVYFKGNWANKFNPQLTRDMPFHVDKSTTKDVKMMNKMENYNFGVLQDLQAKYIELPYDNKNSDVEMSMFVILPDQVDGLKHVEDNLKSVNFAELKNRKREVSLSIPKFTVKSEFNLQEVLSKMGLGDMFGNTANFNGIADVGLKVSKVIQKAYIEVNEEGSEAAAVTGAIAVPTSAIFNPPPPEIMRIDRPFFYAIVSNKVAIFSGQVTDPTK